MLLRTSIEALARAIQPS